MKKKNMPEAPASSEIIGLLNKSLEVEYSFIISYPRIASTISNSEIKNIMMKLGEDSMRHADTVAGIITELGGTPEWSFQLVDTVNNLSDILQKQLQKEELAFKLHGQTAELAHDQEMKDKLKQLGEAEKWHIRATKEMMAKLA